MRTLSGSPERIVAFHQSFYGLFICLPVSGVDRPLEQASKPSPCVVNEQLNDDRATTNTTSFVIGVQRLKLKTETFRELLSQNKPGDLK